MGGAGRGGPGAGGGPPRGGGGRPQACPTDHPVGGQWRAVQDRCTGLLLTTVTGPAAPLIGHPLVVARTGGSSPRGNPGASDQGAPPACLGRVRASPVTASPKSATSAATDSQGRDGGPGCHAGAPAGGGGQVEDGGDVDDVAAVGRPEDRQHGAQHVLQLGACTSKIWRTSPGPVPREPPVVSQAGRGGRLQLAVRPGTRTPMNIRRPSSPAATLIAAGGAPSSVVPRPTADHTAAASSLLGRSSAATRSVSSGRRELLRRRPRRGRCREGSGRRARGRPGR